MRKRQAYNNQDVAVQLIHLSVILKGSGIIIPTATDGQLDTGDKRSEL
jgi:hypothetical protein